jgi:hypothetical protein
MRNFSHSTWDFKRNNVTAVDGRTNRAPRFRVDAKVNFCSLKRGSSPTLEQTFLAAQVFSELQHVLVFHR